MRHPLTLPESAAWFVAPGREILVMETGVFGYFAECRVLDLGGLVSPRFTAAKFTGIDLRLLRRVGGHAAVDPEGGR